MFTLRRVSCLGFRLYQLISYSGRLSPVCGPGAFQTRCRAYRLQLQSIYSSNPIPDALAFHVFSPFNFTFPHFQLSIFNQLGVAFSLVAVTEFLPGCVWFTIVSRPLNDRPESVISLPLPMYWSFQSTIPKWLIFHPSLLSPGLEVSWQ